MTNITLSLNKKEHRYDVEFEGVERPVIVWTQKFDGGDTFEGGWYWDKKEDKIWFDKLNDEDRSDVQKALNPLVKNHKKID